MEEANMVEEVPGPGTRPKVPRGVPADYPERWSRWTKRFRGRGSDGRVKALRVADKVIVVLFVAMYVLMAVGCAGAMPAAVIGYVASTAACFVAMGLIRRWLNAPRPYEVFDIKPLVPKKDLKSGRSFPSRHAFCAFLIATMFAIVFQSVAGMVPLLLAAALGVVRVLEGVHFPRDVVAGAVLGVAAGFACTAAMVAV